MPNASKARSELSSEDLQILDEHMKWEVIPGTFDVKVGSLSVDITLRGGFEITDNISNKAFGF
jgi:hypothetical protein